MYVTEGADRRSTGTHYTPQSLTERVVAATLAPLCYDGVEEGLALAPERLKPPAALLALKICDPACGSGAFLVQACRYLSERLVEAWGRAETEYGLPLQIPEAGASAGHPAEQLLPRDTEERLALARRLIAERCLYGVDLNPMATEMAKLSLWLVTLHRHRPFTFLDHAIKCGDSLLGVHLPEQIEMFHLHPERAKARGRVLDYVAADCATLLDRARASREMLEGFTVLDIGDAERKAELHREAEAAADAVQRIADLIVGAGLKTAAGNAVASLKQLDAELTRLAIEVSHAWRLHDMKMAAEPDTVTLAALAAPLLVRRDTDTVRRPFHWLTEFPEVFLRKNGGFDAIVGNPPFVGGKKITGLLGIDYRDFIVLNHAEGRKGHADLCAYFFLRVLQLVRPGGNAGLLAVNTIAEGDTRQVCLEAMLKSGIAVYAAWPNFPWPGDAAVLASEVHLHRGPWRGGYQLSGESVPIISAFLSGEDEWSPKPLASNANKAFIGSYVLGMGFTMTEAEAKALILRDSKNAEVLFPYLNGEDLNSHPEQKSSRWVINFWDWPLNRSAPGSWAVAEDDTREKWLRDGSAPSDYPGRVAADFPELLGIVEAKVKPERQRRNERGDYVLRKPLPDRWWQFAEKQPAMNHAIGRGYAFARHPPGWPDGMSLGSALVFTLHSKYWIVSLVPTTQVFSHALGVVASDAPEMFGLLQSELHHVWARKLSSSLETRLRYTPTDVFDPFPTPLSHMGLVNELAGRLASRRAALLNSMQIGLTDLYNRFHDPKNVDPPIAELRVLHVLVDEAVRDAYGWHDLVLGHGFHEVPYLPENDRVRFTVSEPARLEILRRLAKLNRDRWQAEQQQLAALLLEELAASYTVKDKRAGQGSSAATAAPQSSLFRDPPE
jgi:hypothetical protein